MKILDEVERRQEAIRFVNEERDRRRAESGTPEPTIAELKHALALKAKQLVPDVDSVTLCDVVKRRMRWLWPQRIPRGKITLLAGNPGLGKSQITCSMASIVTRGGLWPVDRTECEPGSVIILSAEDDPEDTIAPRFEAAEARLERCEFIRAVIDRDSNGQPISRSWDIAADIDKMVRLARMIGDVRLIIIDPISAYLVAKDDDDETGRRRLFLPMKNNLGPDTGGLSYQIVPVNLGEGISTARIEWGADVVATTADEAMAPAAEKNLFREATDMLKEAFAHGSVPADEMGKMAKSTDISIRTFRRAAIAMGAKSRKQIGTGKWLWDLSPAGERGG